MQKRRRDIFVGLALGVVLGGFLPSDQYPGAYKFFRFLSSGFIALIKGLIVPLLFSTIVVGIAQTELISHEGSGASGPRMVIAPCAAVM